MQPRETAQAIARAAIGRRAEQVLIMEMQDLTPVCDFFVICSGRSPVHVKAIAEEIDERLREQGARAVHMEGVPEGRWVLMDYLSVVVHIFTPEAREYYGLEHLWADAPREAVLDEPGLPAPESSTGTEEAG